MNKQTIETIRFALKILKGLNLSIAMCTQSDVRFEVAKRDVLKDDEAILDFEEYVKSIEV